MRPREWAKGPANEVRMQGFGPNLVIGYYRLTALNDGFTAWLAASDRCPLAASTRPKARKKDTLVSVPTPRLGIASLARTSGQARARYY